MREIKLPLPEVDDEETIEINVESNNKSMLAQFRIEPFLWITKEEETTGSKKPEILYAKIKRLKNSIESLNKSWELIQIFAPLGNSKYIKILFRKYD